ncbi:MAG: hypothetical protein KGL39_19995 [Patescibacteria group bacterium]|nr:hypothetical protein [Patescibacteria group bacterium]
MQKQLTIQELDRIREKMRPDIEKRNRERKPETPKKEALVFIELGRYTAGDCRGLFYATQWIYEDEKEPIQKVLADGVDAHICGVKCRGALDDAVAGRKI